MKEIGEILKQLSSAESLITFVFLLLPGFVAVAVYDLRISSERRKFGEMGIALVVYSIISDIFGVGYMALFHITEINASTPKPQLFAFGAVIGLIIPALLGWFVVELRDLLARHGFALDPRPKSWDKYFARLAQSKAPLVLVVTLKDGTRVGGYWDKFAFTSTYPADEDIIIGTPCRLNQQIGAVEELIIGSQGLLLQRSDILSIEAFAFDGGDGTQLGKLEPGHQN